MSTTEETLSIPDTALAPARVPRAPHSIRIPHPFRLLVAALILVTAGALVYWNFAFRSFEAYLAGLALDPLVTGESFSSRETYFVWLTEDRLLGVNVTFECTAIVILVPILIIAAAVYLFTRVSLGRLMLALVASAGVVVLFNLVRLVLIGGASQWWGFELGYPLAHTFLGSVFSRGVR